LQTRQRALVFGQGRVYARFERPANKSVGAVSDRDARLPISLAYMTALSRRRRRLPHGKSTGPSAYCVEAGNFLIPIRPAHGAYRALAISLGCRPPLPQRGSGV